MTACRRRSSATRRSLSIYGEPMTGRCRGSAFRSIVPRVGPPQEGDCHRSVRARPGSHRPILVRLTREVRMKVRHSAGLVAPLLLSMIALSDAQQQPPIGVPVPPLGAGPWVLDTAEQHKIRVNVVTKGLSHPWAIAFLPDGGVLVTERPG